MPSSTIEVLAHEISSFNKTIEELLQLITLENPVNRKKELTSSIYDLENIILIASKEMPQHISEKVRIAFSNLRNEIDATLNDNSALEFSQLKSRFLSQSDKLLHRFTKLISTELVGGNSSNGIIMAQEEERRRISREIHDGPAQTLASLTMRIDYCIEQDGIPVNVIEELQELKSSIGKSLKDIRRFIFDLRPMALDDLGLIPTLEQFITGFKRRTGIPVHVAVTGDRISLSPDKELTIFRVIQEATNNAAKHATPHSINIFLSFTTDKKRLSIVVKDDGIGFDVVSTQKAYGTLKKLGLLSMEERVRLADGEIEIVSENNAGTVVSFWIPIN